MLCVFILVLSVDANNLFLTGKPRQRTAQAVHALVQEDSDQKEQGPASIGDNS